MDEEKSVRSKVLYTAAKMFLTDGYSNTTMRGLAKESGVNVGSIVFAFKSKENILAELVSYIFEAQFQETERMLGERAQDRILFYAAETTLQLYIAESSEHIRDLYSVAYSMPHTAQVIYRALTGKLEEIFKGYLPNFETKDFYEREIASAGIMRNFMTVPCDVYFTMQRKVKSFLETTFLVYEIPKEKIAEAVEFVSEFDYLKIAQSVIEKMFRFLENRK